MMASELNLLLFIILAVAWLSVVNDSVCPAQLLRQT